MYLMPQKALQTTLTGNKSRFQNFNQKYRKINTTLVKKTNQFYNVKLYYNIAYITHNNSPQ